MALPTYACDSQMIPGNPSQARPVIDLQPGAEPWANSGGP
jgi:hypothetical protein